MATPNRYYSSTAVRTTLTADVTASGTALSVASASGWPGSTPFTLMLDAGTTSEELVTVTAISGTNLTVTRGVDGTSGTAHTVGCDVRHAWSARDLREPQEHIAATSGVHGVASGDVVGTTITQTLINKSLSGLSNNFSNIPKAAIPADVVYAAAVQTLTGKTLDGASNTFTNLPKSALPADTIYAGATQTLIAKTLSGASNTFTNIPDSALLGLTATKLIGLIAKANMPADSAYTADIPRVASGEMAYDFNGGASLAHTISFPVGKFTAAPNVSVALRTGLVGLEARITTAPSTTSCVITVNKFDLSAITGTVYVQWTAIQ